MNFPLPIKAVVIDLDGTLLNTAPDLAHAAELMMADLGRPCPSLETISTYIGNGVSRLVKRVLTGEMDAEPDANCSHARVRPTRNITVNTSRCIRVRSTAWLKGSTPSRRWACILRASPNKAELFTVPTAERHGSVRLFRTDPVGRFAAQAQARPLPLLHACEVFKVKPAELLLIGDSLNDTQAARAAGCPVFCVPYGYNRAARLPSWIWMQWYRAWPRRRKWW